MHRWITAVGLFVSALVCASVPVFAQSTDEVNSLLRLSPAQPNARSLAAGGVFSAVAGGSAAGLANPAGLMRVSGSEAQFESRIANFSDDYLDSGSATLDGGILDASGATTDSSDETLGTIAALSFARPSRSGRWTFGGSYSRPIDFEAAVSRDGLALPGEIVPGATAKLDLHVDRLAASIASRLYESKRGYGTAYVGASLLYSRLDLSSRTERLDNLRGAEDVTNFVSSDAPASGISEAGDGCCQFENRGDVRFYETQRGDNGSFGYALGAVWVAPRYAVGASYRREARFSFRANSYERRFDTATGTRAFVSSGPWNGIFKLPDTLEIGATYDATDKVRVGVSMVRVEYADLIEENLDLTGKDADLRGTGCMPNSNFLCQGLVGRTENYVLRDSKEYRFGVEYQLPARSWNRAWSLRAGSWLDPDHRIRYNGALADQQIAFRPEDDELHATVGLGIRLNRYRFDVGIDYSNPVQVAAMTVTMELGNKRDGS